MSRICTIDGCLNAEKARGMCAKHYERWRQYGDPTTVSRKVAKAGEPAAFAASAIGYGGDECLCWPYSKNNAGYGQICKGAGKKELVSRYVCGVAHGDPPTAAHEAAHSCGNGHLGCVTPRHLRWASRGENAQDMIRHGRSAKGTRSSASKLDETRVLEIYRRAQAGEPQSRLAAEFGISQTGVGKIARGATWGWLTQSGAPAP